MNRNIVIFAALLGGAGAAVAQSAQQLQQMQQQRMQQMQQLQQQRAIQQQQQMQQQRAIQQQQQMQQQRAIQQQQQMQQQRAIQQQQQMQQQRAIQQQQQMQQQRAIQQQQQLQQQRAIQQQQQMQQQRAIQQQQQLQQQRQVQPGQSRPVQPFQQGRPPGGLGQPGTPNNAVTGVPQPGVRPGLPGVQPGIPPRSQPGIQSGGQPGLQPGLRPGQPGFQPGIRPGQPGGVAGPAPVDLRALRDQRRVRMENDGRTRIIQEPGLRTIIRQDNRMIIRGDDRFRFNRFGQAHTLRRQDGTNVSILTRPGGVQIISVYDQYGRLIERRRRGGGRDFVFFSNRRARGLAIGAFIAAPLVLAPLALAMPRERYIVDYDEAPPELIYDTLSAPPVEALERRYTVDEVLYNQGLRDRMRRVDLNEINFASGSWEVPPQYNARLARIAQAMLRLIQRNPREVFLVEGHTDAMGAPEDNLTLSDRRAEAIAIILTEQFQVPPENLLVQGYGEQNLKVQTGGPEPRNRRVSIRRITPLLSQAQQ